MQILVFHLILCKTILHYSFTVLKFPSPKKLPLKVFGGGGYKPSSAHLKRRKRYIQRQKFQFIKTVKL